MAIDLADILNLGLTAYNASQGNAGGAASGLSGILGPIFSSGTAPTTGGQGGGFLSSIFGSDSPVSKNPVSEGGGIMDSLGSIFGSSSGPTGYTGPSVWPQVLGSLASSFRATPRAGASREEREKANRYNMLAGILGAVATGYGKASDEAAKQKATSELYQIFSGAQPATAAVKATPEAGASVDIPGVTPETPTPLSRNERLAEYMRQNPAMADVAGKLLAAEQDRNAKIEAARIKAMQPPSFSEMQAADSYFLSQGILDPQERAAKVQSAFAERGKPLSPIAVPSVTQPDYAGILRGAGQAAAEGKPIDVRIPSGAMSEEDAINSFREGFQVPKEEQGQPFLAPGTNEPYPKSAELRQKTEQQEKKKADREEVRFERELERDIKAPFKSVLEAGADSVPNFTKIKNLLKEGSYAATVQAATLVKAALDKSVVQPSEQKVMLESLETTIEKYKRAIEEGITNKKKDLGESARNALLQTAKIAAKVNSDASKAAKAAINEAVIVSKNPNQRIDPQSLYEDFYAKFSNQKNEDLLASIDILNTNLAQELQGVMPKPKRASTPVASAVRTPIVPPVPTTGTTAPETYQYNGKSYIVRRRF
jgi:hypothetical protein